MKDAIDAEAARRVLARLGGETVAVLAKAEAAPTGEIPGRGGPIAIIGRV